MRRTKSKRIAEESESTGLDKVFGNIDLAANILNLLPPKSLVRSKAVSNHWLTLISDPQFLLNYTRHYRTTHPPSTFSRFYNNPMLLSLHGYDKIVSKSDHIKGVLLNAPNYSYLTLLNSCNGLVLYKYSLHSWFIVFNPTTNKHRLLPKFFCNYNWSANTVLAFDPLISFDYKVVAFKCLPFDQTSLGGYSYYDTISEECLMSIFQSKTGSWKQICLPAPPVGLTMFKRVFWNGAIHWISDRNFHVRFNVNEENFTWNEIPTDPNTFLEGGKIGYMGECDTGFLLIMFSRFGNYLTLGQKCTFIVLEMKKDSDYWLPKHHVNLTSLLPQMGWTESTSFKYNVLYVLSGADRDCFSLVLGISGKTILYSINNRNNNIAAKELKDFRKDHYGKFFPFIPCLAPV